MGIPIITTIQQGTHKANAKITDNSIEIHFENPTPTFQANVVAMIDEFVWNKDQNIEDLNIDTFERNKE